MKQFGIDCEYNSENITYTFIQHTFDANSAKSYLKAIIMFPLLHYCVVFLYANKIKAYQYAVCNRKKKSTFFNLMLTLRVRYLQAGLLLAPAT